MIKRFAFHFLIAFLLLSSIKGWARYPLREARVPFDPILLVLPEDLQVQLTRRYPGFHIAQKKDYCPQFAEFKLPYVYGNQGIWSYGAIKGDFNGDRLADYALIGRNHRGFFWLAALKASGQNGPYAIELLAPPVLPAHPSAARSTKAALPGALCEGIFAFVPPHKLKQTILSSPQPDLDAPMAVRHTLNEYDAFGIQGDLSALYYYWNEGRWQTVFLDTLPAEEEVAGE